MATGTNDPHQSVAYSLCVLLIVNVNIEFCEPISSLCGARINVGTPPKSAHFDEPAPLSVLNHLERAFIESCEWHDDPLLFGRDLLINDERTTSEASANV
jgi:hypothetical protein